MSRALPAECNVYLIGPLGAGKTAVGRHLARLARRPFVDTDAEITQRSGADLNWIYDIEGEAGYRQREQSVIADLAKQKKLIISTGGGAILMPDNGDEMFASGLIIYLSVSFHKQFERTQQRRGTRPLLEDCTSLKDNLQKLNAQRYPIYESLADHTVLTDYLSAYKIARSIQLFINSYPYEAVPSR